MRSILSVLAVFLFLACSIVQKETIDPEQHWGEDPWPEIRKQRIDQVLPMVLKEAVVTADGARYLIPPQVDLILMK